MTIRGVSASATNAFAHIDPSETITTSGGALAVMILSLEANDRKADHEDLQAARADYQEALAKEVSEMHAAADKSLLGAIAQGGLAVAAGAVSVYGAVQANDKLSAALLTKDQGLIAAACKPSTLETLGSSLQPLIAPVGNYVSGSDGQDELADAKQASGEGEQAKWVMDDKKNAINQSDEKSSRTTQWVGTLVSQENGTMSVLINNMA
jgi:hypothetical protein